MNKYVKQFLLRGLIFGGFGPIVLGIIFLCIEMSGIALALGGGEILLAIVSTYGIAFVQAGASVFNQIEHWSIPKSTLCHFSVLYLAYVGSYLLNNWIPFDSNVLLIFTGIFVGGYLIIWLTVFISVKLISKKLNAKLQ